MKNINTAGYVLALAVLSIISTGCRDSASQNQAGKAGSAKIENAKNLIDILDKKGLKFDSAGIAEFVDNELGVGNTGRLDGTFAINGIAVYHVPRKNAKEIWLKAVFPIRLFKSDSGISEKHFGISGAASLTVCRADFLDTYFLTKDRRLAKCSAREAPTILSQGGILYYGESKQMSEIYFCEIESDEFGERLMKLPTNEFERKSGQKHEFFVDVVIENLTMGNAIEWQDSWGMYQRDSLLRNGYDSDFLCTWNSTGVFTGTQERLAKTAAAR